jgi:hypothetical protein
VTIILFLLCQDAIVVSLVHSLADLIRSQEARISAPMSMTLAIDVAIDWSLYYVVVAGDSNFAAKASKIVTGALPLLV